MSFYKRISQSQLARGSLLLFAGSSVASFGNFIFNLIMGRLLTPNEYGSLGAIFSLIVLISVPLTFLNMVIVKLVSEYWGNREKGKIVFLLSYLTPRVYQAGFILTVIMFLASGWIMQFLKLYDFLPLFILVLCFLFTGPLLLNKSVIQGTLSFIYPAANGIIEVVIKILVATILVFNNFGLVGAMAGVFVGSLTRYFLTVFQIRIILSHVEKEKISMSFFPLIKTIIPIFMGNLALIILFSVDMILVRHFFPESQAGEYAALLTVGRIIYFVVGPIITVMFPIVSSRAKNGISYIFPLLGTLVMSLSLAVLLITSYFLFPEFIVRVLFGSKYSGIISYLGLFSFYMTIYMFGSILTNFLLSISYFKPVYFLFMISLFQGILIFFFHNTITDVIWVNIAVGFTYLAIASSFVLHKEGRIIVSMLNRILSRRIYE